MAATWWERVLHSSVLRELVLLLDNWVYLLPILILLMAVGGGLGRGLGFPNIFREDEQVFSLAGRHHSAPASPGLLSRLPGGVQLALASPALWSGFGFMAVFGLFWIAVHANGISYCGPVHEPAFCPTTLFNADAAPRGWFWLVMALALAMVLFLLLTWWELRHQLADFTTRDGAQRRAELLRTAAGCVMGALFVLAAMQVAASIANPGWQMWIIAIPYAALLLGLFLRRSVLPCLSLASLIIGLILIGALYPRRWLIWEEVWIILGFALVVTVNHGRTRYRLPGFEPLYDDLLNPQSKKDKAPGTPLIPPRAALESWRDRHAAAGRKPMLVLLATSGGAYRAGFWTGLLMDRLVAESGPEGRWPGLAGDIRLITGASGGMVAGAYFAAMAAEGRLAEGVVDRISHDTLARMGAADGDARRHPIARDSLSPIVHRLVTRDLLHLVVPWRPMSDRGKVLDRQWATLGRSFASIRASEAAGIAPSIILSPMLVETGAVALFSNLDLMEIRRRALPMTAKPGDEDKASVEVFRTFPGTHEHVSMATAVRLNATFPYISPAISLPTSPDRRAVDAGYYDNYGIDLLTAYLDQQETQEWITRNCAGVAILQIRAFPSEPPTMPVGKVARALQFLTSPVEGIMHARRASQIFRNDQQLAQIRARYNQDGDFLKVFTFEASTDVSMSWYLRCDELRALERLLSPPVRDDLTWDARAIRARGQAVQASGPAIPRAEVEDWTYGRYAGYEDFIAALQRREPEAQWAQFLHHRAKIAAEFDKLAGFWQWARSD